MTKPIIGVDVDLTIIDIDLAWIEYVGKKLFPNNYGEAFARVSFYKKQYEDIPYNIADVFKEELEKNPIDLYDFWRSETLYNELEPIEDSVKVLKKLSKDYRIVFCSAHKGWHAKSKYYFLNRWFPFHSGVILTQEKHMCCKGWDVYIDDRVDILNKCKDENENLLVINYSTPYEQKEFPDWEMRYARNWNDIEMIIRLEEKLK